LTTEETKDKQDRIIEVLEEMLVWTKVTSIPHVKTILLELLPGNEEKIAYHLSDGEHSSQEVAKPAGVSFGTVTRWWKNWVRAGIAKSVSARGGERAKRLFSLEDFGIEVPQEKEVKKEETTKSVPTTEMKTEAEKVE
jgi:hypothetical protein